MENKFTKYRLSWTEYDGRGGEQEKQIEFWLPSIAEGLELKYIQDVMATLEEACADPERLMLEKAVPVKQSSLVTRWDYVKVLPEDLEEELLIRCETCGDRIAKGEPCSCDEEEDEDE